MSAPGRKVRLIDKSLASELDARLARLEVAASALSAAVGTLRREVDQLLPRQPPEEQGWDAATLGLMNL